jgi:hypothetical protein
MYPPFGQSNIYFRVRNILSKYLRRAWRIMREWRPPRPTLGKVWLRLSYFEERLFMLNHDNREVFIENFYHSARQINYITLLTVFVIIGTYLTTFQFRMIGFWEGITVEGLLIFSLFYIVWYYRMGMEDLLDYLLATETTPDYAFRPRLGTRTDPVKPVPRTRKKIRRR